MQRREFLQWIGLAPLALAAPLMLPDNIPVSSPKWMDTSNKVYDAFLGTLRVDPTVGPIDTRPSDVWRKYTGREKLNLDSEPFGEITTSQTGELK